VTALLHDGSCIRLRHEYLGHAWAYDFAEGRTHVGRKFRILAIIDEASPECMLLLVARRIRSADVLAILADLFFIHCPPAHIWSDNGPEFITTAVKGWLTNAKPNRDFSHKKWTNLRGSGHCQKAKTRLAKREAVAYFQAPLPTRERLACKVIAADWTVTCYQSCLGDNEVLRQKLYIRAHQRRRLGCRWQHILLR
jgi:hypothetical protein